MWWNVMDLIAVFALAAAITLLIVSASVLIGRVLGLSARKERELDDLLVEIERRERDGLRVRDERRQWYGADPADPRLGGEVREYLREEAGR